MKGPQATGALHSSWVCSLRQRVWSARRAISRHLSIASHAERTLAVNMKLHDASLSVIEAAQVMADTCFCQSREAIVLDRILNVIDELGDVICALQGAGRRSPALPAPVIEKAQRAGTARHKVFVPEGRGSIFGSTAPSTGVAKRSGGRR